MKNIKQLFASLESFFLLLMVFTLCACSGSESGTSAGSGESASTADKTAGFLKNKDFTQWNGSRPQGWTPEPWVAVKLGHSQEKHDGKDVVEITPSGDHIGILYQNIANASTLHQGDTLAGSIWVKASEPDVSAMIICVVDGERRYSKISFHPGDGQWHQLNVMWPYVPGSEQIRFAVWADEKASKPFYIADVKLDTAKGK